MAHNYLAANLFAPNLSHYLHAQLDEVMMVSCCAGGRSAECRLRGRAPRGSSSCRISQHPSALRVAATPLDSEDRCPHHAAEEHKQQEGPCKRHQADCQGGTQPFHTVSPVTAMSHMLTLQQATWRTLGSEIVFPDGL